MEKIKINVQMFGGRGASSIKKEQLKPQKMERVYKQFNYGKELVAYKYGNYNIDITEELGARNLMYGATHKWYTTTLANGERYASDILKEVKAKIDEDRKNR